MLFKSTILFYGRSLSGQPIHPEDDVVGHTSSPQARDAFRRQAIEDISAARVFVLDPEAATYADSFRESMQGGFREGEADPIAVCDFMREVALPADLVWVEYDHTALARSRLRRGHDGYAAFALDKADRRGFLFDNRATDHLKVTLFRARGQEMLVDPIVHSTVPKDDNGHLVYGTLTLQLHEHMLDYLKVVAQNGAIDASGVQGLVEQEQADLSYEMVLAYALFALIDSRENGLIHDERPTLTTAEAKTARKFGKTWISDVPPSFYTIRIGPEARAHLTAQAERRAAEREARERNSPIRHKVSEHERRYKNGKIVKIAEYYRGKEPLPGVPILVRGPRAS